MNALIRCLFFVALSLGAVSCRKANQENTPTNAPAQTMNGKPSEGQDSTGKHSGKGRVYDKKNGFSIIPPKSWVPFDEPSGNPFLVYNGPEVDGLRPNLNVRSGTDDGTPIEAIGASLKAGLGSQLKQWKLLDDGFITIDGNKAYFISSQYVEPSGEQLFPIQNKQYALLGNNKKLYILTFTTTPKHFDGLKKTFDEAAQTARTD